MRRQGYINIRKGRLQRKVSYGRKREVLYDVKMQQGDITLLKMYEPNKIAAKCIKLKLIKLKAEIEKFIIVDIKLLSKIGKQIKNQQGCQIIQHYNQSTGENGTLHQTNIKVHIFFFNSSRNIKVQIIYWAIKKHSGNLKELKSFSVLQPI